MSKLVSKPLVNQKCKYILADVQALDKLLKEHVYEALVSDPVQCTLAERYLERIVNRAIDINFHFIRAAGKAPPDDYTQSFLALVPLKILSAELAQAIAPAAGARNILVHEYDNLDSALFYSSLQDAVRLFPQYVRAVELYVE